jgi:hypothetical protein
MTCAVHFSTPRAHPEGTPEDTPRAPRSQRLSQIRGEGCVQRTLAHLPPRGRKATVQAKSRGWPGFPLGALDRAAAFFTVSLGTPEGGHRGSRSRTQGRARGAARPRGRGSDASSTRRCTRRHPPAPSAPHRHPPTPANPALEPSPRRGAVLGTSRHVLRHPIFGLTKPNAGLSRRSFPLGAVMRGAALRDWCRRVAFGLVRHRFGTFRQRPSQICARGVRISAPFGTPFLA